MNKQPEGQKEKQHAPVKKSLTAEREEKVLEFWKKHNIFEQSLAIREKAEESKGLRKLLGRKGKRKEFVFYDGPPFATGLPHYGTLLSSIAKDLFGRYQTMQGNYVRRRWGWDCHGLPIENMIEKKLGLKMKKDIEELGIAKFNETCRSEVLRFADEWKVFIDRIGRWVEFDNSYKTMDATYTESVWWLLKKMWNKELLYEGRKVLMYCPHCETPLAKAEIAQDNSYKDVTEESVIAAFKIIDSEKHALPENTYILAWTTTPWTLPGNVALAVGAEIDYALVKEKDRYYIVAHDLMVQNFGEVREPENVLRGSALEGIEYEPLYDLSAVRKTDKKAWYVTIADFVTTAEGTGIVHTAVIYGEDDYSLGLKLDLPMVPLLNESGVFNTDAPKFVRGTKLKEAEKPIKDDLEKRELLFNRLQYTHSYPHCYRCDNPLIYNALSSWFIDIQKIKKELIKNNENITWVPEHIKHGQFLNIVKNAPDWNISRNRYWASPLPIWKCADCPKMDVLGSVVELKQKLVTHSNTYHVMRHGEAKNNLDGRINATTHTKDPLTETGREQVRVAAETLKTKKIDMIVTSPVLRTKETAQITADVLGISGDDFVVVEELAEWNVGEYEGKTWAEYHDVYTSVEERFTEKASGGESLSDVKQRVGGFIYTLHEAHDGKNILIVTHNALVQMLFTVSEGADFARSVAIEENNEYSSDYTAIQKLPFVPLPHNAAYELDLHRPYIDSVVLSCACGGEMQRIPEVVDCWVESGSMPFAEYHYPFENKEVFESRFPGDFVTEYLPQTRTWFYYMHALSSALFSKAPFKNVVTTGNILAEDGTKMSKSKGNYTDPMFNIDHYGSDALRYYMMTSVVMQAEDFAFSDEGLREVYNKVINMLSNVLRFYTTYSKDYDGVTEPGESTHVLDVWILEKFRIVHEQVTGGLNAFNTVSAGRPLRDFIGDLSTWYLRRSRDRFKSDDEKDKQHALATLRYVLLETAKLMAPFTPFLAESIYQDVRTVQLTDRKTKSKLAGFKQSVHLEDWTKETHNTKVKIQNVVDDMQKTRDVVSLALEARDTAGFKVRQPLAVLKTKADLPESFRLLIADEVNVKSVVSDENIGDAIWLDTTITQDLKREGQLRELTRHVQNFRKKSKLTPDDRPTLIVEASGASENFVRKHEGELKAATLLSAIEYDTVEGDEKVKVDDMAFELEIKM